MRRVKYFFIPLFKAFLFILVAIGGAEILYSEVIFPGYEFLPFEIYNPILDMTKDRFLFRVIFLAWSLFLYFFLQFILKRQKWKNLVIANEKHKAVNFLKGSAIGFIYAGLVIVTLLVFKFFKVTELLVFSKETFILLLAQFGAIIATAFFLELIFRATVLELLKNYINIHVANLITSVAFASIFIFDQSDYYPIKQLALSMFLGYMYYKYGFYVTFGFHFGFNYLESFFFSNSVFKINLTRQPGFTPLTELSLVSFAFFTAATLWFLFNFLKKNKKKSKKKSPF